MKQGLSLRVSQHLALTPQLQQSIRLLQLSTLELAQEIEQMLDDNPFLELTTDEPVREEPVRDESEAAASERMVGEREREREVDFGGEAAEGDGARAEGDGVAAADAESPGWEGDGSTEAVSDDGD